MKNIILPLLVSVSLLFVGCSPSMKFSVSSDPERIPNDIKKDGYVLLVLKQEIGGFQGTQNRGVEKMMTRYYNGAFEMVGSEDLKSTKYADTNKYRYIIGRDYSRTTIVTTTRLQTNSSGITRRTAGTTHAQYNQEVIYDRMLNKSLGGLGYESKSYSLGMKAFAQYMGKKKFDGSNSDNAKIQ